MRTCVDSKARQAADGASLSFSAPLRGKSVTPGLVVLPEQDATRVRLAPDTDRAILELPLVFSKETDLPERLRFHFSPLSSPD